jgi:hypothetical protein
VIQRHTLPAVCGVDRSCHAYWSLRPTRRLLFFVHGFGGHATSTWRELPRLILNDNRWSGWDLFFYGYDSRRIRAGVSAELLGEQVKNLTGQPGFADAWLPTSRPNDFRYEEIWFVTHSLGSPLVRQMLVNAASRQAAWLQISHLICFAPASTGARIERMMWLLGTTSGGLMGFIHAIFRQRWVVLDDLKVGSKFLKNLLLATKQASGENAQEPFSSRLTLFGVYEDVVEYPPAFPYDNRIRLIHGADHCTVCKPRYPHHLAYSELVDEIKP